MQQRFLLQILLLAEHVSGTTMPIITSSRFLYSGWCLQHQIPHINDDARSKSHQIQIDSDVGEQGAEQII